MRKNKWKTILLFTILLYLKSMIFTFMGASDDGRSFYGVEVDLFLVLPHLALISILLFPGLFFKERGMKRYFIGLDIIYSVFLIASMWVYRASGYFYSLKYFVYKDLFNPLGNSLFNPSSLDLLFIIDIFIFIYLYFKAKDSMNGKRSIKGACLGLISSLIIVLGSHYLFDIVKIDEGSIRFFSDDWEGSWNPSTRVSHRSPLGDQIYEGYRTLVKLSKSGNDEEINEVNEWLNWNKEDLPNNEFYSIAKGKNVVFLQIESLENFVINQEVYGQEITPVLNKLSKEGLYFNNIHEQNNAGNSIDCDMMINTGILPLGDTITFLSNPEVKYNSLARILEKNGYSAVSTHAERAGDWSWAEAHRAALGFQDVWDINDYDIDEYVGFGLSDRSFYTQYVDKLTTLTEPFFSMLPTLSSHGPFDIGKEYRKLDLPEDLDNNRFGGYLQSVHYADEQIGHFLNLLEEKGLMDDTIVVIYGDHGGIHKYYNEDIEATNMPGDWWQSYEKEIPLLIYGSDLPNKTIEKNGGQIDVMPTVSYLLGIDNIGSVMGRNLLNTNRDATVIKGGEVIGNPTEEEKEKLQEAYKIGEYIIKNNYFENKGLIN
ncbi:MAG: LTA synthase family protein [Clostridiales bacterium]|nr:LTA synthase family protein [Clostridiales bacterium]